METTIKLLTPIIVILALMSSMITLGATKLAKCCL